jgi:hypothetical protein
VFTGIADTLNSRKKADERKIELLKANTSEMKSKKYKKMVRF